MNNFFTALVNRFRSSFEDSHIVLELSELKEFYLSAMHSIALNKRNNPSKNNLLGDNASEYNGQGMDYSESRIYSPGDDTRFINWKQSAKSGELISNKYYQEANNIDYVLFDTRHCMFFGTQVQTKLSTAIKIAMITSASSINKNRKLKILTITNEISRSGVIDTHEKVLGFFSRIANSQYSERMSKELSLESLIKSTKSLTPINSSINIISDFHDMTDISKNLISSLNTNNNISLHKINDPIEKKLPPLYPINYQSLSSKGSLTIANAEELKKLNKSLESANKEISNLLKNTGSTINNISNTTSNDTLIDRYTHGY